MEVNENLVRNTNIDENETLNEINGANTGLNLNNWNEAYRLKLKDGEIKLVRNDEAIKENKLD